MKFTKDDINRFRQDPQLRLLSLALGLNFDEALNKYEEELNKTNESEANNNLPICKLDYNAIVEAAKCFNEYIKITNDIGMDFDLSGSSILGSTLKIIYYLLVGFVGVDFAKKFITGLCSDQDPDYFQNIYNEQIRNN